MISGRAMLAGVIGDPVSHSLSPRLHGYWIKKHQLDAAYVPLHVTPQDLPEALKALPKIGFCGVNLTLPHKETALTLMDEISCRAGRIGAVNTVIIREGGSLYGDNTDGIGFIDSLKRHQPELTSVLEHVIILGAGGAARSILVALKETGARRITLCNRNEERAQALAENFGVQHALWQEKEALQETASLLVNTTSLGMQGQPTLDMSLDKLPQQAWVSDIVYQPLETPLLRAARLRGNRVVGGLGMLICQAAPGFEAWFGIRPEIDAQSFTLLEEALCASSG